MASKDKLALLIGGPGLGGDKMKPEGDEGDGDRKALAEKAFAKAVKSGTGIADALEELMDIIDGAHDEDDAEPKDEPADDEE